MPHHTPRHTAHPCPTAAARRGPAATAWALVSWSLVACAPLTQDIQPTPPPLPARYADASPPVAHVVRPDIGWRDFFQDAALLDVLQQALAHNHDLRLATLRVAEARAAYGIQRADRLPTLATSLAAARTAVPGDLSPTRRPLVGDQFQLGVGFSSWEIDFWGRVGSLNEAALQNHLTTAAAQRAATVGLIAQVAQTWLGLRETEERLVLAERSVGSRAESLRIFRRRVELGATSPLELKQVELLWQQARLLATQLRHAQATQRHALHLLVGGPVAEATTGQRLAQEPWTPPLHTGLPSDLLLLRPDIVAAEHALQAANANVRAARAAFFPRITLTTSLGTASSQLDGLFQAGSQAWSLAPSLVLPLFDGGRLRGALDLAEVRREQTVVRYEQTVQAAFRDVADALAAQRWLADQRAQQQATLVLQQERARLAKLRYDSGAVRYLEVLDAERDLLAAEQQAVQLRRAQLSAQVALYAALGGGALPIDPSP